MFQYTFEEFKEVFDKLTHSYEKINLENEKKISNRNFENEFLRNAKLKLKKKNKILKMAFKICGMNLNDAGDEKEKLRNALENYEKKN